MMKRVGAFSGQMIDLMRSRYISLVFRLAVGVTLIISGTGKIAQGSAFVEEVARFELLPESLVGFFGNVLPWVELIVGVFLILGLLTRAASGVAALVALSLVIANGVALDRGLNLECGCFGDLAALETRQAIIIDAVLLAMALQILFHKGSLLALDQLLFRRKAAERASDNP